MSDWQANDGAWQDEYSLDARDMTPAEEHAAESAEARERECADWLESPAITAAVARLAAIPGVAVEHGHELVDVTTADGETLIGEFACRAHDDPEQAHDDAVAGLTELAASLSAIARTEAA